MVIPCTLDLLTNPQLLIRFPRRAMCRAGLLLARQAAEEALQALSGGACCTGPCEDLSGAVGGCNIIGDVWAWGGFLLFDSSPFVRNLFRCRLCGDLTECSIGCIKKSRVPLLLWRGLPGKVPSPTRPTSRQCAGPALGCRICGSSWPPWTGD